jgi:hypothetical protein
LLNRFLRLYQHLSPLPAPACSRCTLGRCCHKSSRWKPVSLSASSSAPPTTVLADAVQMQHPFINLIRTAVEVAPLRVSSAYARSHDPLLEVREFRTVII